MAGTAVKLRELLALTGLGSLLLAILTGPLLVNLSAHPGGELYALFSVACHQLPERSLSWLGAPLPVCARCTGVWMGLFAVASRRPLRWRISTGVALLLSGVLVADWWLAQLSLFPDTLFEQWSTGLVGGAGFGTMLVRFARRLTRLPRSGLPA